MEIPADLMNTEQQLVANRAVNEKNPVDPDFLLLNMRGTNIGFNYSWVFTMLLITYTHAHALGVVNPGWGKVACVVVAFTTIILLSLSVLVHECSHAICAKAYGLPVRSITLFALGGMAHLEKNPMRPGMEFWIGIIGPITSFIIGVFSLVLAWQMGWRPETATSSPLIEALITLAEANIALAVFNMLPAYPMDGGRVLRAIIWRLTGQTFLSTVVAVYASYIVSGMFVILGLVWFVATGEFVTLVLAAVGGFLYFVAYRKLGEAKTQNNDLCG